MCEMFLTIPKRTPISVFEYIDFDAMMVIHAVWEMAYVMKGLIVPICDAI